MGCLGNATQTDKKGNRKTTGSLLTLLFHGDLLLRAESVFSSHVEHNFMLSGKFAILEFRQDLVNHFV
jgi:hypothetical protein